MDIKERVSGVLRLLDENYPTEDKCYLHYEHDWQLLIATVLSAQCTDDRVNTVTEGLFKTYADIDGCIMPSDIEELTTLAGVGRKTANVVRTHIFHIPSIVVDTHVKRISGKIGFTKSDDPVKIEFELMELFPKEHWGRYNTQVIAHGRTICKARKPDCENCCLREYCLEGSGKA